MEILATVLFAIAVLHTFLISRFQHLAHRYPEGSIGENFFHLLGEVEVVFGLWAGVLIALIAAVIGAGDAVAYAESLNFTEPAFVFAIMTVAATRPVVDLTRWIIRMVARMIPLKTEAATYLSTLVIGPLLGSFITEPAAMTVTAFVLRDLYFSREMKPIVQYMTIAVLLVNVSIGGVLTHFAAPPVLMVAGKWEWGLGFMMSTFGWKAVIAVVVNAVLATLVAWSELMRADFRLPALEKMRSPVWLTGLHLLFLAMIVMNAHHMVIFAGLVLFFLGVAAITSEYQDPLKLRESLLVAFFLGGLVVLGGLQKWWLEPLIRSMDDGVLFLGAAALTAITDNAALTYLGAQVEGVSDGFKYALVAGAVAGGGLTVIANAPNPVAFSVLQSHFGPDGISPLKLLAAALVPTFVAMAALWFL